MNRTKYIAVIILSILGVSCFVVFRMVTTDLLNLEVLVIDRPSAIVATFRVSMKNTSPWTVEFRQTKVTVYVNGMVCIDSNPDRPSIWREFQLSPYATKSDQITVWFPTALTGYQIYNIEVSIQGELRHWLIPWQGFSIMKSVRG